MKLFPSNLQRGWPGILLSLLLTSACSQHSGLLVNKDSTQTALFGVVERIDNIELQRSINGRYSNGSNAMIGGIIGTSLGDGNGSQLVAGIGVITSGASTGTPTSATETVNRAKITVLLANGKRIHAIQSLSDTTSIKVGSRVQVIRATSIPFVLPAKP